MMVKLSGVIDYYGDGFLIIENQGVGYRVIFPQEVLRDFDGSTSIFIHEVIRDTERELFGFPTMEALELFWKLIGISGVGPKIAQKIVLLHSPQIVRRKIMEGDLVFLTDIPGIGKKTAQKIILELKGVIAQEPDESGQDIDAIDALIGLGYSRRQAQDALRGIDGNSTEDKIKNALKSISL